MKTKKLLSFMLAIVMVVSMMATLGINASAAKLATWVKVEKYGKTFWYRTDKVTHNDGEHDESWECECWDLIVGKFAYAKPDEYDDGDWYDVYPCEHLVEYEPLTSLVMKPNSAKTDYVVGDKIDLTGAQMTATTISEATEDVNITSSMVSGFDSTTAGKKTVTVTYRNLTTSFDVTVAPQNECWLDLDENTTDIKEKKELDQNYNLTVTEMPAASGAVTKVKLSWEINDINAVRMDNKVWDTTELKWVTASSNTNIMDNGTAKFTLENYSSVKVRATATFAAETGFDPTVEYTGKNGRITLDTANGNDTYSKTNVPTGTINVTVKPGDNDFDTLAATASATKYGTYTVTLSDDVSEYQSYANGIATATAPATFVVDEATKTITIKDEKAFLYYGLVYRANTSNADDVTAKLDADLDLDDLVIANGFNCKSNFDGQNHTIANLTVIGAANSKAGFFKTIDQTGSEDFVSVKNLVLDNIHVNGAVSTGESCNGILVGYAAGTEIRNVTVQNSSVTGGKYTGGIAGISYTDIIGCTVKDSTVSGQYKCGGLIGFTGEGDGRDVQNNTLTNVTINCANLLAGKTHYETGKVIGNWNSETGTYIGNTVTNVTIVNGSVGYTENEIGAIESGCTIDYGEPC